MTKIEGFVKDFVDEASDEEDFKSREDKQPWQDIPLVPSSNPNNGQHKMTLKPELLSPSKRLRTLNCSNPNHGQHKTG